MRWVLQIGTLGLLLTAVVAPMFECFDRWDGPGLGNDTELPLFCLSLMLALVLTLVLRMASRTTALQQLALSVLGFAAAAGIQCTPAAQTFAGFRSLAAEAASPPESPPPLFSPLRI